MPLCACHKGYSSPGLCPQELTEGQHHPCVLFFKERAVLTSLWSFKGVIPAPLERGSEVYNVLKGCSSALGWRKEQISAGYMANQVYY